MAAGLESFSPRNGAVALNFRQRHNNYQSQYQGAGWPLTALLAESETSINLHDGRGCLTDATPEKPGRTACSIQERKCCLKKRSPARSFGVICGGSCMLEMNDKLESVSAHSSRFG